MDIKELIRQKKLKKLRANERFREERINENYQEIIKEYNAIEDNINRPSIRATKKVNNVSCDHSLYVFINPDTITHIKLKNKRNCINNCKEHSCTFLCPSHVYGWTQQGLKIDYERCVECGACNIFCPSGNIQWSYPRSGYGIQRKY